MSDTELIETEDYAKDVRPGITFTVGPDDVELTLSDAEQSWLSIVATINQSLTAAYNALKINVIETAIGDGSSGDGNNLLRLCVSGITKFKLDNSGRITLPQLNEQLNPTLAFGDGDTGFFESADDTLRLSINGTNKYFFASGSFGVSGGLGPQLLSIPGSTTIPGIIGYGSDPDTGISRSADDQLSIIAGGAEQLRLKQNNAATDQATLNANLFITAIKSGATQAAAAAAANEVWKTSGHATLPDNVLMIGV